MIDLGEVYSVNLNNEVDHDTLIEELELTDILDGCREGGMYIPYTMTIHVEHANGYRDVTIEDEEWVDEDELITYIEDTLDRLTSQNQRITKELIEMTGRYNALKATIEAQEKEQALLNTICPDAADTGC